MKGRDEKCQRKNDLVEEKVSRAEKMRQWRMVKFVGRFTFDENIEDINIFREYQDKEMLVLHNCCGKKYKVSLNNFYIADSSTVSTFSKYTQDKKDLNCPHCLQDAKNKYLKEIVDNKAKGQYEVLGDYINKDSEINLLHKVCLHGSNFKVSSIVSNKELKCSYCSKLLNNNDKRRQKKLIKLKEEFTFSVDIEQDYIFDKYKNEVIGIKHNDCNKEFEVCLSKFNDVNMGVYKYLKGFLKNDLAVKCPYCLQDAKNRYFQYILDNLRNDEFLLVGNYQSIKEDVEVLHKCCGEKFNINSELIVSKKRLKCPKCDSVKTLSNEEQKNKNLNFNKELKAMKIVDFECIGDYVNRNTETEFLHVSCGHKFKDIPENFLRRLNKCPECSDYKKITFKSQEERNEYFQDCLNKEVCGFKLIGDYNGRNSEVTLYHSGCKKQFTMVFDYFVDSKYKCPCCQTKKYKYNPSLSIKEKIKYFEDEIGGDYKILTGFTVISDEVKIKHIACGREFEKKVSLAMKRSENSILCPYCELEKRKESFEKKLKERFGDKYVLYGEYVNGDTETTFRHTRCMKVFKATPNKILERKFESCPHCDMANKERGNVFKKKLYSKYKSEYILVGEYLGHDKKTLFKHRKCGELFWENPMMMLKKDIPCKMCALKKRILPKAEVLKRIKQYNGDMYKMCGEYLGTEKKVPFMCSKCGGVLEIEPCRLFRKKICPQCGQKHT